MDWKRECDLLMAHCAEIVNGIVVRVVVISNDYEPNVEQFATDLFGGEWKQTSYNGNIRKNYAGVGFTYDKNRDAFIPPEPEGNLGLDETTCQWIMPVVERE
jgi:hypothetical protein